MIELKKEIPGIILATIIGLVAYALTVFFPELPGSILSALLLGMLVSNFYKVPESAQSGVGFTSSKLLELSILFLAFGINYTHIAQLGAVSFSIVVLVIMVMLLATYFLSRKFNCPGSTGWLIGFGTAICGSSAIAALAPRVTQNKEDVGIAMAVVNLFGSIGMIILPMLLVNLGLDTKQISLMIGGSLHSVGNVVGAGYGVSNEVGEAATTIKLARVAMLSPGLIFFNYLVNRSEGKSWKQHFSLPWYLWSFIGITLLTSVINIPTEWIKGLDFTGKLILTVAMAAIGLKVSFKKLIQSGKRGLVFGLVIFLLQLLVLGLSLVVLG